MKNMTFISVIILLISCSERKNENMESDNQDSLTITGAWEVTHIEKKNSDTSIVQNPWYKSIYIYTDKYYSVAAAIGERASAPVVEKGEKIDSDYFKEVYLGYLSNSGTYQIVGDSLIQNVIVAKSPTVMNSKRRTSQHITLGEEKMVLVDSKSTIITTLILERLKQ